MEPDIEVIDDPGAMAQGKDPQLDRALQEVEASLKMVPMTHTPKPVYPKRSGY